MPVRNDDEISDKMVDRIAEAAADRALKKLEDQIPAIAEQASQKALEKFYSDMYAEIGRSVVKRMLWAIGLGASAVMTYLGIKGQIPGG